MIKIFGGWWPLFLIQVNLIFPVTQFLSENNCNFYYNMKMSSENQKTIG